MLEEVQWMGGLTGRGGQEACCGCAKAVPDSSARARRVDKTHFSQKYDVKTFMEAEFARRNLFKQIAKESAS